MRPNYEYGTAVRVIRNVRNDGTFPGMATGELLVRRGSVGYVRSMGTFLQDQIIYEVDFLEAGRLIGCREEELIEADAPWRGSRFEFREKVVAAKRLSNGDEILAEIGDEAQVLKVLFDDPEMIYYHVRFPGRTLMVPESALEPAAEETDEVSDASAS